MISKDQLLWATMLALSHVERLGLVIAYIDIVRLPDKLDYQDGEEISLAGSRTLAYRTDGSIWGEVPIDELHCVPEYAGFTWHGVEFVTPDTSITIGNKTISGPFYVKRISRIQYQSVNPTGHGWYTVSFEDPVPDAFGFRRDNGSALAIDRNEAGEFQLLAVTDGEYILVASKRYFGGTFGGYSTTPDDYGYYHRDLSGVGGLNRFTYNGKTAYYHFFETTHYRPAMDESEQSISGFFGEIAWYLCYGNDVPYTSPQDIIVEWPRPGDSVILSDRFSITVYMDNN